nr:MAG TPA: capsid vertex protein [Caudoviricetes sp.]
MAKLRNLKIENEALAGVNVADAAEISITITSNVSAVDNKFTDGAEVTLTANVTADGNSKLAYEWFKGVEQVGTTNPLAITVGNDTKGDYKCKVTATYDDGDKSKDSDIFTIDIAEDPPSEVSPSEDETKVGNRTLSEHLRMRLLGYI